jgi:hypothetical protein
MPFFVAAFAAAPSAGVLVRGTGVAAVALGATSMTIGVVAMSAQLTVAGGLSSMAGIGLVGVACIRPLLVGLGPGRGLVTRAYVGALAMVLVGAALATTLVAGWDPVAAAWVRLKPAHVWLNLIGFLSLIISTTLVHSSRPSSVGGSALTGALGSWSWRWSLRQDSWPLAIGSRRVLSSGSAPRSRSSERSRSRSMGPACGQAVPAGRPTRVGTASPSGVWRRRSAGSSWA